MRRLASSLGFVATLSAPLAAQTTWVVDDNGTGDFVHIQDAIDTAVSGDVIYVLDGAYAGFTIDGESLVVAAEAGAEVQVSEPVVVRNVGAGQRVELDGLSMGLAFSTALVPTLLLEANAGSVRLVDCEVVSQDSDYYSSNGSDAAVACFDSAAFSIVRSTLLGAHGAFQEPGTSGLFASGSNVHVIGSVLQGGDGGDDVPVGPFGSGCAFFGGSGLVARSASTVKAFDSSFVGGFWGKVVPTFCGTRSSGVAFPNDATGSNGEHKDCTSNGGALPLSTVFTPTAVASFCFGTWEECPCGNNGAGTAGCEGAFGTGGVRLEATGQASVGSDTIRLSATGLNPNAAPTGLFFQGTEAVANGVGTPFTDGLLCAGGTILRLKGKSASGGAMTLGFGNPNDQPISVRGALPPEGGTRIYQLWYRNAPAMFCPPSPFNMSNGVEITWAP